MRKPVKHPYYEHSDFTFKQVCCKQMSINKATCETGFTLIEVMVALAILAVVAVASYQASAGYVNTITGMKTRTLAHFVAQNAGAQLKINNDWLAADRKEKIDAQGRSWQVLYTQKIIQEAPSQNLQSVNINVAEIIEGTDTTGTGTNITITLTKPSS